MSDTRTNSGVDNVSKFRKMFHWGVPGERIVTLMASGNLATTQAVVSQLEERTKAPSERQNTMLDAPTMFQVATIVANQLRDTIRESDLAAGQEGKSQFTASMILTGQIAGMEPRMFLIYPEGNFIEASQETPFFQVGETKYGRPIIIRAYQSDMTFEDAAKLLMVSFDSTLKANLSVGLPLDLMVVERDTFAPLHERRIEEGDEYFSAVSERWSEALRNAFHSLPDYEF